MPLGIGVGGGWRSAKQVSRMKIQVSLVICGGYIPSFWTANLKFEDKKSIFDWQIVILAYFFIVNKQIRR
jgi:hypothetical protein